MLALLELCKVLIGNPRCCCRHPLLIAESIKGALLPCERAISGVLLECSWRMQSHGSHRCNRRVWCVLMGGNLES